jgi:uracil-DNA glycosylase
MPLSSKKFSLKSKSGKSAADFIPSDARWEELREASQHCRGCDLYKWATQAVFGEGNLHAGVMLVGEAPGNAEDKKGRPFVGPAGALLDKGLEEAGIERDDVYITNAVKHFKFVETAHYRLHRNPSGLQIDACRPWLDAEIDLIQPEALVCLGAVAARSVFQRTVLVGKERGVLVTHPRVPHVLITVHPSSMLRMRNDPKSNFAAEFQRFVSDLRLIRKFASKKVLRRAA